WYHKIYHQILLLGAFLSLDALIGRSISHESLLALARTRLADGHAVTHQSSVSAEGLEALVGALSEFLVGTARICRSGSARGTFGSVSARSHTANVGASDASTRHNSDQRHSECKCQEDGTAHSASGVDSKGTLEGRSENNCK
ncbi:hypothetical protein PFISCL1PPCAC_7037, partial [Pristionchus fissidentatus]